MKNKRILLVEDKYEDIIAIQDSLKAINGQHTLHVVHNISDALQVLMGGSSHYGMENYSQTGKVRPDIVLLNIGFLQESAREFLEVMNKYYSLKNIKVFITGESQQALDPALAQKYGIAGYLSKPFDLQDTLNESVLHFRQELVKPGKALLSLSFLTLNKKIFTGLNYLKAKWAAYYLGTTVAAKLTTSVAVTVLAAGVLSSSNVQKQRSDSRQTIAAPQLKSATVAASPVPEQCTEQEAIVAAESIDLPDLRRKTTLRAVTPDKVAPQAIASAEPPTESTVQMPAKQYKIVAVEEAE